MATGQNKEREKEFFTGHAACGEYDVFDERTNRKLLRECLNLAGLRPPTRVADLGCGSGAFTQALRGEGFDSFGLDLSQALVTMERRRYPGTDFVVGDVEFLPLPSASLDGVLLSGILHHLPDPEACARELHRVLRPGGIFMSFDPNRLNPCMWLYRDKSSPFYSRKGVTENERPVLARDLEALFSRLGFEVKVGYLSGLSYHYVASPLMRLALPLYNALDALLFRPEFMRSRRAFVLLAGAKKDHV
jgi:SAM-dependent methyltransferase